MLVFVAFQLLSGGSGFAVPTAFDDGAQAPDGGAIPAGEDPEKDLRDFSEYVFDSTQSTWAKTFGGGYRDAKLYLYRSGVSTGCGSASSAVGPFYCPADERVYLDLSFYGDMQRQLGAPGDFAWAYVIAHEVGHHVQHLRGTDDEVRRLQREDPDQANPLVGAARAPGRLLRGRLGARRLRPARPGRRRGGDHRLRGGRRRPAPAARAAATWTRTPSRTGPRRSGRSGSGRGSLRPAGDCDTFGVDSV